MAEWTREQLIAYARQQASRYGLDPDVFARQLAVESDDFAPDVVAGRRVSSAGALGVAQFMPETARALGIDPLDPAQAIEGAARLDRANLDRYGRWDLALAAYNAGSGAVDKYGAVPPYAETQRYVQNILGSGTDNSGTGGGPMTTQRAPAAESETLRALREEARRVKQDLDAAAQAAQEVDEQGDPTPAAMAAQKRLPKLQDDYRSILVALSTREQVEARTASQRPEPITREVGGRLYEYKPGPGGSYDWYPVTEPAAKTSTRQRWTDPTTGAEYLIDTSTGEKVVQLSPPIEGYRPTGTSSASELAKQKRDQLWSQVARGEITPQKAVSDFSEWWKLNVDLPKTAADIGESFVSNYLKMLPYQVGPKFGEEFAGALKTLSGGGGQISFSPEALTFQMPDLGQMAQQAASQFLGQLNPAAAQVLFGGGAGAPAAAAAPAAAPAPAPTAAPAPPAAGANPSQIPPYTLGGGRIARY